MGKEKSMSSKKDRIMLYYQKLAKLQNGNDDADGAIQYLIQGLDDTEADELERKIESRDDSYRKLEGINSQESFVQRMKAYQQRVDKLTAAWVDGKITYGNTCYWEKNKR